MTRAVALPPLLLVSGCLVVNPAFMLGGMATGVDPTGATDEPTTDAPPTTAPDGSTTTGATSTGATGAETTGDLTTAGSTTTDDGTTADPTGSDASTGDMPPRGLPDCAPGDLTLIACYDFEPDVNDPARLVDGSQFGNDGVLSDVEVIAGVDGQGLKILDATKISVPDDATLAADKALSLGAWVQIAAQPPAGERVGILDKDGQWGLFIHATEGLACTVAGVKVSAAQPFPIGMWTHVGCVFDGQQLRLYVDGQLVADAPDAGSIGVNAAPLLLGCNSPSCDERMIGGRLDAVRVWNIAVTDAVICAEAANCE